MCRVELGVARRRGHSETNTEVDLSLPKTMNQHKRGLRASLISVLWWCCPSVLVHRSCMMLEQENEFYNNYQSQRKKTNYLLMQGNRNTFSAYNDPSNLNRI